MNGLNFTLFETLRASGKDQEFLERVCKCLKFESRKIGTILFEEGDKRADKVYFL